MIEKAPSNQTCPQCSTASFILHPIDSGMQLRLQKVGIDINFKSVCSVCYKTLSKNISSGSLLQAEKTIKNNYKTTIWKSRLSLIRTARIHMERQEYSQGAVCYEKYLKVIEYVYDKPRATFNASLFKNRPKEVTIIAAAFWALMEIYDKNKQFWPKQELAAAKLGELIGYTNLYTAVVKNASVKIRSAQNPKAFKIFMKTANIKYSNCFIASIAYPNRWDPTMLTLCAFRDLILTKSILGRFFIRTYYRWSPSIANHLQHYAFVRQGLLKVLPSIAACLNILFSLDKRKNL